MVDLLPEIEVVSDDAFNSSPTDPGLMGPEALKMFRDGTKIPSSKSKTPLVCQLLVPFLFFGFIKTGLALHFVLDREQINF